MRCWHHILTTNPEEEGMQMTSLRADKWPHPVNAQAAAWADRFDALLAGALAGIDAGYLYPALMGLYNDIADGAPDYSNRLVVEAQRLQVARASRHADHCLVAGNLLFLHDWLSRFMVNSSRYSRAA
jgi:hypothetical protein